MMKAALADVFLSFFEDFLSDYQGGSLGRGVSTSRQLAGGKSGAGLAVTYFVAVNTRFYGTSTASSLDPNPRASRKYYAESTVRSLLLDCLSMVSLPASAMQVLKPRI